MGCWNKTCGLSGLHINAGTDTYVFILEQGVDPRDRCYTTALWAPLLLPFEAEYDDYGGGENCSGFVDLVVDGVRDNLIEVEQGENEYHDIPVTRADFSVEKLFEACLEGRLETKSYMGGERLVDFVMFRKDVVDEILATHVVEKYVGDGKGTSGWGNSYIKYTFTDVVADLPAFVDKLVETINTKATTKIGSKLINIRFLDGITDWNDPNKVNWYMNTNSYRYSSLVHVNEEFINLLLDGQRDRAEQLLHDHIKASFIDAYMNSIRKMWIPGGHEGSQEQELSGYRTLVNVIGNIIDREQAELDIENEGEDE